MMRLSAARRGTTLVELIIALTIFGVIIVGTLSMLDAQLRAFAVGTDRMTLLQNFRFAANTLEQDLRTVGSGVPGHQPFLVYAGEDAIAFNANYASNVPNDLFAVYSDTTAPNEEVEALRQGQTLTIPGTSITYPDTTYLVGATNSPAEMILFFFAPDSTTARTDDYVLYRQVNRLDPEVVAHHLLAPEDASFFEYLRLADPEGEAPVQLVDVPTASVPLEHPVPIHLAAEDTGRFALIDSVRAVRINMTGTNGRTGEDERRATLSRVVALPNAGLTAPQVCGAPPILGTILQAVATTVPDGNGTAPAVELSWTQATDESGGEGDIGRYVIWRRRAGSFEWGNPLVSVPSGLSSYLYVDRSVEPGNFEYALAAQDCTPSLSDLSVSGTVTVTVS